MMSFFKIQIRAPRPTNKAELAIWNEKCKHRASWCNQLANGFFGAGVITPFMVYLINNNWIAIIGVGFFAFAFWFWWALLIHLVGSEWLDDLMTEDDLKPKEE